MIEIRQVRLPVSHTETDLRQAVGRRLRGVRDFSYTISRKSIDSRKKHELKYVYTVLVKVENERQVLRSCARDRDISRYEPVIYQMPKPGKDKLMHRPVIAGAGPAGLFCALMLARAGYQPRLIERGADVDERVGDIEKFWETGILKPDSNVQFGEGGAGTFSDGKLNTLVKDKYGRNRKVLETFVEYGAPQDILIESKPHIGTDLLRTVIKNMRNALREAGGSVEFHTKLVDLVSDEAGGLTGIVVERATDGGDKAGGTFEDGNSDAVGVSHSREVIDTGVLVLALGHSARDTFEMLHAKGVEMTAKAFAIGLRIEHGREVIQRSQYGDSKEAMGLPAASYKLTYQAEDGRGVFSFCMCPGGFVVNASSENGMLAVNGMSNRDRGERNSNSAIIVTVNPDDYEGDGPLAGIAFQRRWERAAYDCGGGRIPVQRFADLCRKEATKAFGRITPNTKGTYRMADLNKCLPDYVIRDIIDGIQDFERKIEGFSDGDAILAGIESRTSSPVRIERNDAFESSYQGIYPCGEGAGYAGGITSAAMDGIKVFEAIVRKYAPIQK